MKKPELLPNRQRRQTLALLGSLGALPMIGCQVESASTESSTSTDSSSSSTSSTSATTGSCTLIPTETQGPYPLLSIIGDSAMIRPNITEGKTGVPLTLTLSFVDVNNYCEPISGIYVYVWHCDKDGRYSGYSNTTNRDHVGETFLRGLQQTDENGQVTFVTIYPGWYTGRITHIHFQAYLNLNGSASTTSQIAFPQAITKAVYNSSLYADNGQNTSVTSFSADNIFSDGTTYQMATVTGSVDEGYVATLKVGIAYA